MLSWGVFPSIQCLVPDQEEDFRLFSPFADSSALSSPRAAFKTRTLAARLMELINEKFVGSVGRFSQVQIGAGVQNDGTVDGYQRIGAITSGWETSNFTSAFRPDVTAFQAGKAVLGQNTWLPEPNFLEKEIMINKVALKHALKIIVNLQDSPPRDEGGFCNYPLAAAMQVSFPVQLWGAAGFDNPVFSPILPQFGVPLSIVGECPGD